MTAPASPTTSVRALAMAFLTATEHAPLRGRWRRERGHCRRLLQRLLAPRYDQSPDAAWDRDWLLDLWWAFLTLELVIPFLNWTGVA